MILWIVIYVIIYIIQLCIFGTICQHINEGKGYYGGFAWGFLGVIGIIVVACRSESPQRMASYFQQSEAVNKLSSISANIDKASNDCWVCIKCGRRIPLYSAGCICGMKRDESNRQRAANMLSKETAEKKETEQKTELNNIELIKKYKELLDMGIITTEEFERKKSAFLSGNIQEEQKESADSPNRTTEWICRKCGTANSNERGTCYYCGSFKE